MLTQLACPSRQTQTLHHRMAWLVLVHLIPELILSRVVTSSPTSSRVAGTSSHRPGSPQQQLLLHWVVEAAHRVVQARASHRQRRLMLVLQRVVEARRASPRLVLVLLGIALVSAPARGSLVLVLLCASPQQQLLLPLHRVVEAVVEAAQLLLPLHRVVEAVVEAAHRVVEASHRLMLLLLAAPPQIFWFCWWRHIAVI